MLRWSPLLHLLPHESQPAGTVDCSSTISEGGGATKYVSKQLLLIHFFRSFNNLIIESYYLLACF